MRPNLYRTTIDRRRERKTGFLLTGLGMIVFVNLILLGAIAVAWLVWLPPVQ